MSLSSLPPETLHNIFSCDEISRTDLRHLSLVSRNIWEVATTILYSTLDIHVNSEYTGGVWTLDKRYQNIVQSIASNHVLGSKIRNITVNFFHTQFPERNELLAFGEVDGQQAAKNMPFLANATLVQCGLTRHIIANIAAYSQLTELSLRLGLERHLWSGRPAKSVKALKWQIPYDYPGMNSTIDCWDTAANVLQIASINFPEISELEISNTPREFCDAAPFLLPRTGIEYEQSVLLRKLRTFRYIGKFRSEQERQSILPFLQKHRSTLTCLSAQFGFVLSHHETINIIERVTTEVPNLKCLVNPGPRLQWTSHKLPMWSDSMYQPGSHSSGLEFFEMWNIGCQFSKEIGEFFFGFSGLRVLKVGSPLLRDDERDGRPHFDEVAPKITNFVDCLPKSIEELYIGLENIGVACEEHEDFDPIEELPSSIFQSLPRLHTLDITAKIANVDMTTGWIPEKAVICRRRPSEQSPNDKKQKTVWKSRLDAVYQEEQHTVRNTTVEVYGDFKGDDASEPWLGGRRSWVSQREKHWANGEYLLGEDVKFDDLSDEEEEY